MDKFDKKSAFFSKLVFLSKSFTLKCLLNGGGGRIRFVLGGFAHPPVYLAPPFNRHFLSWVRNGPRTRLEKIFLSYYKGYNSQLLCLKMFYGEYSV